MKPWVLCYHAANVGGCDYANNDHVALAEDLRLLARLGICVLPLEELLARVAAGLADGCVAITCDDGIALDAEDFEHPVHGFQPSFRRILDDAAVAAGRSLHLTSFAIASRRARAEIDAAGFLSLDLWHDRWWPDATRRGIAVESHSFDHNHPALLRSVQRLNQRGDFFVIDNEADCDAEVAQASDEIEGLSGRRPRFFAYPWGQASDFLRRDYLPRRGREIGLQAAFSTQPEPLRIDADPWYLPRLVCGEHWHDPAELESWLRRA